MREVHEELGVEPADPRAGSARADPHVRVGILVTPFVGVMPCSRRCIRAAPRTARAFTLRIRTLAEVEERHVLHRDERGDLLGWRYAMEGTVVWGATGFMLHALLRLLREEAPWMLS